MSKKSSIIAGIIIGIAAIAGGIYIAMSLTSVDQGEVGVVWSVQNGVQEKTLGPGIHFVGPFNRVAAAACAQQQCSRFQ